MHARLFVVALFLAALLAAGCATQRGAASPTAPPRDDGGVRTAAAISNVWYVPGRAIVCGASAVLSGLVMTITLGHSYDDAARIVYGGCSGPWTVEPSDVRQAVSPPGRP